MNWSLMFWYVLVLGQIDSVRRIIGSFFSYKNHLQKKKNGQNNFDYSKNKIELHAKYRSQQDI